MGFGPRDGRTSAPRESGEADAAEVAQAPLSAITTENAKAITGRAGDMTAARWWLSVRGPALITAPRHAGAGRWRAAITASVAPC